MSKLPALNENSLHSTDLDSLIRRSADTINHGDDLDDIGTLRLQLLVAGIVADSVASTSSIFHISERDTDYNTRTLQQQTLRAFDELLQRVSPGINIANAEVLKSLPKLASFFGVDIGATGSAIWQPSENLGIDGSYLGFASANSTIYFAANSLLRELENLQGQVPDRSKSKIILGKLTVLYVSWSP